MLLASASILFAQHQLGATLIGHTSEVTNWATTEETTTNTTEASDFASSIEVQPIRARGYVKISAAEVVRRIHLYDQYGKEVLRETPNANAFRINTEFLTQGVYMIVLASNSNEATAKLIW